MQVSLEIQNQQVRKTGDDDSSGLGFNHFHHRQHRHIFHRQQVKEMAEAKKTSMRFLSSIVRIPLWWVTIYIHSCFI